MTSAELLLVLLIAALYLHDAVTLMASNEAVLELRGRRRWATNFPTRRLTLLGKHVHVGGLLPPGTLVFRLAWDMEHEAPARPGWEACVQALQGFRWASTLLFGLVLVLLPFVLLTRAGDTIALLVIATIYVMITGVAAALWFARERIGLSRKRCLQLTVEALLCPPVAANLSRRLSLQCKVDEDFVSACRRLLPGTDWPAAAAEIRERIEDEIELEDVGTHRHLRLVARRAEVA